MPKPCSLDLRMRLLEAVIAGASRREAADCFDATASSAVKWLQLWQETGSVAAKPTGGSISPLEEHADWLLALISKQSDLTLDEVVCRRGSRAGGAGIGGTAPSAASIRSPIDQTRSVIPSAIAGVIRNASCMEQKL